MHGLNSTGKVSNLTAIDRVSIYHTGLFFLPGVKGFGFTPLIKDVSKPFVMDRDGKNKRDVSGAGGGFAYGYSASPNGKQISYHENYQIHIANADGGDKRMIETKNPSTASFRDASDLRDVINQNLLVGLGTPMNATRLRT